MIRWSFSQFCFFQVYKQVKMRYNKTEPMEMTRTAAKDKTR